MNNNTQNAKIAAITEKSFSGWHRYRERESFCQGFRLQRDRVYAEANRVKKAMIKKEKAEYDLWVIYDKLIKQVIEKKDKNRGNGWVEGVGTVLIR